MSSSGASSTNSRLPSSGNGSGGASGQQFAEPVLQRLMSNGFSREQVISELTLAHGDEQKALMSLLAKSLQF